MCEPFSCLYTRGGDVLAAKDPCNHSHAVIIKDHNLQDTILHCDAFVKVEVIPRNQNYALPVKEWRVKIDEYDYPEWMNRARLEKACRLAASKWQKAHVKDGVYCKRADNGDLCWYRGNVLHREDGPARIDLEGNQWWYRDSFLHREDGPAVIFVNGRQEWRLNGLYHREGGPAVTYLGYEAWWHHGVMHRVGGPALTCKISETEVEKFWFENGVEISGSVERIKK